MTAEGLTKISFPSPTFNFPLTVKSAVLKYRPWKGLVVMTAPDWQQAKPHSSYLRPINIHAVPTLKDLAPVFHKTKAIHHLKGQRGKISAHFSLNPTRERKLTLLPTPQSAPSL